MKLSEVCLNIVDCPHSTAPDEGVGYALIRTPNIGKGRFNLEGVHRISETAFKKRCARITPSTNDLILAREAPAGNVAIIKEDMEQLALGQRTVLIRPNPEKVYPDFLVYYLLAPKQQQELLGRANGATVAHVNIPVINNLPVNLPSLSTQKKIASILSAYDDLIENNRKQIKLLEEAAQKLYKEWFVKLNFPGHENTKNIDGIPEGWSLKKLDKVFSFIRGKSYSSGELSDNEGTLFVNLKNIQAFGGYKREAEKRFLGTYKAEQTISSGDVVMGVTDMTKERRLVGSVAQIPELGEKATYTMDLIKLLPFEVTNNYLYSALRFGNVSRKIAPLANGVNVLHLKPEALNQVEMLVPESSIVSMYDKFYEPIRLQIERKQSQISLLQSARDKLLPKLMNDEMDI